MSAHLRAKDTPGVFSQGLVVYSGSGDEVLFEQLLDMEIVSEVASFCEENGVSLIAYSGDDIVSVCDVGCSASSSSPSSSSGMPKRPRNAGL